MLNHLTRSLSARLLLLFICAGAVLLLLVGVIVGKGYSTHLRSSVSPFLLHYVQLMEQQLGSPPERQKALYITQGNPVAIHVYGPAQNWSTADQLPEQSTLDSAVHSAANTSAGQGYRIRALGDSLILQTRQQDFDVYFQVTQISGLKSQGTWTFILWSIVGILVLIYYATKALFKPIEDIQTGVSLIGSGHLDHRISKRRNDQLGDLADNVNAMADDINKMLEAKRQLLLGISHELRSPLTRSRVNLALMEDSTSKQEVEKDIIAMEQMITELLESERLNSRHVSLNYESVSLDQLVRDIVDREFPRKVQLMELAAVTMDLDQARVRLLLRNLLQNAVKHSVDPQRRPTISVVNEFGAHSIYVTDSGGGIEADQITHLTEPFYRADPSRQRKTGGYGLGLYLCKVIMEAHGGEITITSEVGIGTTIRCSFASQ